MTKENPVVDKIIEPLGTHEELRADGYVYAYTRRCNGQGCGAEIEFWKTPNGKWIPLNPETLTPHHATCPDVDRFRRKKKKG